MPLVESMEILEGIQTKLTMEPFKTKLSNVLQKNPDLQAMGNIYNILKCNSIELDGMSPELPYLFKCAPITSVDCERTFSNFRYVLADNRTNLTVPHLCDILLIQWNKELLK